MIIQFPGVTRPARAQHSRRRAQTPRSVHTYRRALLRRMGMCCAADRPAIYIDALAREILAARV
jgi:hypothetical protein